MNKLIIKHFYRSALSVALLGATGGVGEIFYEVSEAGDLTVLTIISFVLFFSGMFAIIMHHIWKED